MKLAVLAAPILIMFVASTALCSRCDRIFAAKPEITYRVLNRRHASTTQMPRNLEQRENSAAALSNSGRLAAIGFDTGKIVFVDPLVSEDDEPAREIRGRVRKKVTALAFSPDDSILAAGYKGGEIIFWDVATGNAIQGAGSRGEALWRFVTGEDVTALAYNSHYLVAAFAKPRHQAYVQVFHHSGTTASFRQLTASGLVRQISLSANHSIGLAVESYPLAAPGGATYYYEGILEGTIDLSREGARLTISRYPFGEFVVADGSVPKEATAIAHSQNGDYVAFAVDSPSPQVLSQIQVWSTALGVKVRTIEVTEAPIDLLKYSSDGKRLVSISKDGAIRLWDSSTWALGEGQMVAGSGPARAVEFTKYDGTEFRTVSVYGDTAVFAPTPVTPSY